jgi:4-aminobutyrate aminotransferase-like enzyme
VIAFSGAYHGVGYGALNATQRDHFRAPFRSQLREFGYFVPFPKGSGGQSMRSSPLTDPERAIRRLFRQQKIGAILVEPIQVRGGINIPPLEFLPMLRRLCDEHGALLILDEIYTGFGRTGKWFGCEHSGTVPDVICLGKALTGGFPLSACVGRAELMDAAWPYSNGEAIHTSTFLGHPVGCAMALAQLEEIKAHNLVRRSAELGPFLLSAFQALRPSTGKSRSKARRASTFHLDARGLGLLAGAELSFGDGKPAKEPALEITKQMLHQGFIVLPEGEHSNVLGFTPPLTITKEQLSAAVGALGDILTQFQNPKNENRSRLGVIGGAATLSWRNVATGARRNIGRSP